MRANRLFVGLYGLAFHAVVVGVIAWVARRNQADVPASFWTHAVPPFLVAAFAVYAVVVAPYVPRRTKATAAVFFDSAVGMFAEVAVFVLAAFLHAVLVSGPAASQGGAAAYAAAVTSNTLYAALWAFGSFFLQILVVGNAAGLVGWWVLKRVARRHAPA